MTSPVTSLVADNVTKTFGGIHALDGVTLDARPAEIHGLIGPNGSGKTTLLNLLCGYYKPDGGAIRVGEKDLTGASVQSRARLDIARTFQKPRLLGSLSVLDNAMLGGWVHTEAGFVETLFGMPRALKDERRTRDSARDILAAIGLGDIMDRRADVLDHAHQRFLEIARGLVLGPKFLLLDEPAGGLAEHEIEALADVLRTLRDCGLGILIVEHHTDFVFKISDRVTTLNLGQTLRHGTPDEVRTDPEVIRVYLGA
ncbi:ABC transporter ATP-binding protein [Acuticoccus sediminis]|uniref:ABC transporter ATP-binding protein n=1 Tax=Acuticoccus sediminis TaxID=2184697 RepID=A0A8B2NQ91_9HYPH|nr:ABC transporter ATP-binding protein [Acuticoccus sediminis]RAH99173.1 ABC transporter ATP-binding protein [Acuticoccus sediminis]